MNMFKIDTVLVATTTPSQPSHSKKEVSAHHWDIGWDDNDDTHTHTRAHINFTHRHSTFWNVNWFVFLLYTKMVPKNYYILVAGYTNGIHRIFYDLR